mgnify:FL=1
MRIDNSTHIKLDITSNDDDIRNVINYMSQFDDSEKDDRIFCHWKDCIICRPSYTLYEKMNRLDDFESIKDDSFNILVMRDVDDKKEFIRERLKSYSMIDESVIDEFVNNISEKPTSGEDNDAYYKLEYERKSGFVSVLETIARSNTPQENIDAYIQLFKDFAFIEPEYEQITVLFRSKKFGYGANMYNIEIQFEESVVENNGLFNHEEGTIVLKLTFKDGPESINELTQEMMLREFARQTLRLKSDYIS